VAAVAEEREAAVLVAPAVEGATARVLAPEDPVVAGALVAVEERETADQVAPEAAEDLAEAAELVAAGKSPASG
jgi:hypothetical protein